MFTRMTGMSYRGNKGVLFTFAQPKVKESLPVNHIVLDIKCSCMEKIIELDPQSYAFTYRMRSIQ